MKLLVAACMLLCAQHVTCHSDTICIDNSHCADSRCCREFDRECIPGQRDGDFCLMGTPECNHDSDCALGHICIFGHCHDENGESSDKCADLEKDLQDAKEALQIEKQELRDRQKELSDAEKLIEEYKEGCDVCEDTLPNVPNANCEFFLRGNLCDLPNIPEKCGKTCGFCGPLACSPDNPCTEDGYCCMYRSNDQGVCVEEANDNKLCSYKTKFMCNKNGAFFDCKDHCNGEVTSCGDDETGCDEPICGTDNFCTADCQCQPGQVCQREDRLNSWGYCVDTSAPTCKDLGGTCVPWTPSGACKPDLVLNATCYGNCGVCCNLKACDADQWRCDSGDQCIDEGYTDVDGHTGRCDKSFDCADFSDEDPRTCRCWVIEAHTADVRNAGGGGDRIYIDLIDDQGKKSVERRLLGDKLERNKVSTFSFCTPRDENLGQLVALELSNRVRDNWIMDRITVKDLDDNTLYIHDPDKNHAIGRETTTLDLDIFLV